MPVLLTSFILEIVARSVPNPYKYKYEWMQAHAKEVNTLVLGSSHTFEGIRPEYLDGNAFNLANVAQGIEHDLFLLKYWADQYEQLNLVIYPISYFTWRYEGINDSDLSNRCRYYKIYMDCDLYSDFSKNNLEISNFLTARKKIEKAFKSITTGNKMDPLCSEYGSDNTNLLSHKNKQAFNDTAIAANIAKGHTKDNKELIVRNYEMMRDIASFCQKRHVRLVIITTPCWNTYNLYLNNEQLNEMYGLIVKLQKEFNFIYLDYLKDKRFTPNDFQDCNHLSDSGAIKFTKILNHDIHANLQSK